MSELKQLQYQRHHHLRVDTSLLSQHIADQRSMPIVISEFQNCAIHFPIVISKNADTGAFMCVAMLGFEPGENLFWKNRAWDALYTPLNVQRQPFFVGSRDTEEDANSDDNYVLCIDENSPCLSKDDKGEAIFTEDGKASQYLETVQVSLRELLSGERISQDFIKTLVGFDLLAPLSLDITFNNQQSQRVDGAYTINEEKLAQLNDEQVLQLHKSGYLGPIYTMLVSLGQLYPLIERKNQVLDGATDWFKQAEA